MSNITQSRKTLVQQTRERLGTLTFIEGSYESLEEYKNGLEAIIEKTLSVLEPKIASVFEAYTEKELEKRAAQHAAIEALIVHFSGPLARMLTLDQLGRIDEIINE